MAKTKMDFPDIEFYPQKVYPTAKILAEKITELSRSKILDAGCGSGWLSKFLSDNGKKVTCIDEDISTAKKFLGKTANIKTGIITKLPFRNEKFDTIICMNVLEHVEDINKAKKELLRVLKPGGTLIISMPNKYGLFSIMYDFNWKKLKWKEVEKKYSGKEQIYGCGHHWHFTIKEQKRLFGNNFSKTKFIKIHFLTPLIIRFFGTRAKILIKLDNLLAAFLPEKITNGFIIFKKKNKLRKI